MNKMRILILLCLQSIVLVQHLQAENNIIGAWRHEVGWDSHIECGNVTGNAVELALTLRDAQGSTRTTQSMKLEAHGASELNIANLGLQGTGWYEVQSNPSNYSGVFCQMVSHNVLTQADKGQKIKQSYLLPEFALTSDNTTYLLPQKLSTGRSLSTKILLLNPEATAVEVHIETGSAGLTGFKKTTHTVAANSLTQVELTGETPFTHVLVTPPGIRKIGVLALVSDTSVGTATTIVPPTKSSCDLGPVGLNLLGSSVNELFIRNAETSPRNISVQVRSASGELVDQRHFHLESDQVVTWEIVQRDYNRRAAFARVTCETTEDTSSHVKGISALVVSHTLHKISRDKEWLYVSTANQDRANGESLSAFIVNTRFSALNHARFFEYDAIAAECLVNVYEAGGSLFTQNQLTIPPECAPSLQLDQQTGSDFLGLTIIRSPAKNSSYRSEVLRIISEQSESKIISILHAPARIFKLTPNEMAIIDKDPELQFCSNSPTESMISPAPAAPKVGLALSSEEVVRREQIAYDFIRKAEAARRLGDWAQAAAFFRSAVDAYPKHLCARLSLAWILYGRLNKTTEALNELATLLQIDPDNFSGYDLLGSIYLNSNQMKEAEIALRRARELDPEALDATCRHAKALYSLGQSEEAMKEYERIVKLDNDNVCALESLAFLNRDRGNAEAAGKYFSQIALLAQNIAEGTKHLDRSVDQGYFFTLAATAFLETGKPELAAEFAASAKKLGVVPTQILPLLALAAHRQGQLSLAKEYYTEWEKIEPQSMGLHINVGDLWELMGDDAAAEQSYRKACESPSSTVLAYNTLGWFLYRKSRYSEARTVFERARAASIENGQLHINAGLVYEKLGEVDLAGESYLRASKLNPENAWAWNNLALIRERQGNIKEAQSFSEAAVVRYPKAPQITSLFCRLSRGISEGVLYQQLCRR